MRTFILLVGLVTLAAGCARPVDEKQQPAGKRARTADPEEAVRMALVEQFRIAPKDIDMEKPLTGPPYDADDLDIVELVMHIEESLGIDIPDAAFDKHGGLILRKGQQLKLTPAELVVIVREAKAVWESRNRKENGP